MAGLLYLQHAYDCSDEVVVNTDKVIVDTTVMPKAVAHPTDSRFERIAHDKQEAAQDLMHRVKRILTQTTRDKNKLYALHAPEVECISKENARTPYEFGVKVSVAITLKEGFVVGQKRGISRTLHAMIKRRSAIEPTIGHMKTDGRLARNPLKGALGDALHAVLCGAGHNIRLLLKKLRLLFTFIVWAISGARPMNHRAHQLAVG